MKKKIIKYSVILVIIGITIAGIFTSALARYFYKLEVQNNIENTAIMLSHQVSISYSQSSSVDFNNIVREYSDLLNNNINKNKNFAFHTRITIIDFQGKVVGDSDSDIETMENHLTRKEVQEAIQGNIGRDQRFSKTMKMTSIYTAIPVKDLNIIVRVSVPLNQLDSINKAFLYYTLVGIIAGLLLSLLISLKISNIMTEPIHQLIFTSREIAGGNYKKRVDVDYKDEIGQLAVTFNEMADKLDETLSSVMDKNIKIDTVINSMRNGIIAIDENFKIIIINTMACDIFNVQNGPGIIGKNLIDITRNSRVNSLLRDTIKNNTSLTDEITLFSPNNGGDKIFRIYTNTIKSFDGKKQISGGVITFNDITSVRKLEQIRTKFVSNVTHELKTPLTSIRGFVETLKNGAIDDSVVAAKFLDIIDIEAERLYNLINDVLQLSEIESMRNDENIKENDLCQIINEVILILESAAEKKEVHLEVDTDCPIPINVNRDRIKQMLINLIDNAIKYNVKNGTVYIKAEKSNGKTMISIKDTGIGVSEVHQSRIFERFYRVDKGRSRNMGGTGLGLSIVKHIVNLYNGDIRIKSEPGKGTEFFIQLPL
jgi:two-component system phosphate regulon sensor histidine kinase PhoR